MRTAAHFLIRDSRHLIKSSSILNWCLLLRAANACHPTLYMHRPSKGSSRDIVSGASRSDNHCSSMELTAREVSPDGKWIFSIDEMGLERLVGKKVQWQQQPVMDDEIPPSVLGSSNEEGEKATTTT